MTDNPSQESPRSTEQRSSDKLLGAVLDRMNKSDQTQLRWRNIRFFTIATFVAIGFLAYWGFIYTAFSPAGVDGNYVAMVRVDGAITADSKTSALKLIPAMEKAFKTAHEKEKVKGVIISINSPGGSPVQSSLIHDRLIQLGKQYPNVKYVAVGEDSVTSGAYYIATGAPEIYVNRSTITGSIGVISSQFGLTNVMEKVGVQRRVYTAGKNKAFLDMYLPVTPEKIKKMDVMLSSMHAHFIDSVKETRSGKIKISDELAFSGEFWTGDEALQYGLVDGLASLSDVMRDKFDVDQFQDMTPKPGLFESFGNGIGVSMGASFADAMFEKYFTEESINIR